MITVQGWTTSNKIRYQQVFCGPKGIGIITEKDGRFTATGRNKPVDSIEEAISQLLNRQIKQCESDLKHYKSELEELQKQITVEKGR
jgi:hypothetical protein